MTTKTYRQRLREAGWKFLYSQCCTHESGASVRGNAHGMWVAVNATGKTVGKPHVYLEAALEAAEPGSTLKAKAGNKCKPK